MHNSSIYVYNPDALAVSALILFGTLAFHAFYLILVNRGFLHAARRAQETRHLRFALEMSFLVGAFVLSAAHIVEIFLIGFTINAIGLVQNIHHAIVFAGSTYTTVGFGSDPLPQNWQLVMVTIALVGLLTVAWTTSVLFGMATMVHSALANPKTPVA